MLQIKMEIITVIYFIEALSRQYGNSKGLIAVNAMQVDRMKQRRKKIGQEGNNAS